MTLSFAISAINSSGNKKQVLGTGTVASGDTTGDILTGLTHIEYAEVHYKNLADKTFQTDVTTTEGTIALTFTNPGAATKDFLWEAIGW